MRVIPASTLREFRLGAKIHHPDDIFEQTQIVGGVLAYLLQVSDVRRAASAHTHKHRHAQTHAHRKPPGSGKRMQSVAKVGRNAKNPADVRVCAEIEQGGANLASSGVRVWELKSSFQGSKVQRIREKTRRSRMSRFALQGQNERVFKPP